jgi:hypothetical protein
MIGGKVFPNSEPFTEDGFKSSFAPGIAISVANFGLARLAKRIGATTKTITNAIGCKGVIRADLASNLIQADPGAFTEWFARMGFEPCSNDTHEAPDAVALSALATLMAAYARAMEDGRRDHRETRQLATLIRPMLPWLRAIVRQGDGV